MIYLAVRSLRAAELAMAKPSPNAGNGVAWEHPSNPRASPALSWGWASFPSPSLDLRTSQTELLSSEASSST